MVFFDDVVIGQLVEAFNRREFAPVLKLFSEDLKLHCSGQHPAAGDYFGRDGLLEFWRKQIELSRNTLQGKIVSVCQSEGNLIIIFDITAEREGKIFAWRRLNHYLVSEGRVVEGWVYESDQRIADEALAI